MSSLRLTCSRCGHAAHDEVNDPVVKRIQRHVPNGMRLLVLHSAHMSKIFCTLIGTAYMLK